MSALKKCLGMLALLVAGPLAQAHIASNGFLSLQVERAEVSGSLELAIRDGELAVGLDRDRDGKVSWGELRASGAPLQGYVLGHLNLAGAEGACKLKFGPVQVNERVDGNYLWLPLTADCGSALKRLSMVDRKSTRLNSSHLGISYAVFCL